MKNEKDTIINKVFFSKYLAIKKLGEGSFGMIYKAKNENEDEEYALKFESRRHSQNLLQTEAKKKMNKYYAKAILMKDILHKRNISI